MDHPIQTKHFTSLHTLDESLVVFSIGFVRVCDKFELPYDRFRNGLGRGDTTNASKNWYSMHAIIVACMNSHTDIA